MFTDDFTKFVDVHGTPGAASQEFISSFPVHSIQIWKLVHLKSFSETAPRIHTYKLGLFESTNSARGLLKHQGSCECVMAGECIMTRLNPQSRRVWVHYVTAQTRVFRSLMMYY